VAIRLDPKRIRDSRSRIPREFLDSGQFVSDELSAAAGRPVVVKVETVNPIGSFKGRGAWLAVDGLVNRGVASAERGVVVASTGNFGQAIAYAGRAMGVPITVFAGTDGNPRKLARIAHLGATVRQEGHDFDAAREHAAAFATTTGQALVVDSEDVWTAIGAGTLAVELTDAIERGELPPVVAAYIPVGNGALIAGVGAWMRHASPTTRVIGVQSDQAPSMTLSWHAGRPIETETVNTHAGGISTRVPVPEALEMMDGVVDDMVLVSEQALDEAQAILQHALGVTAELASAASWAGFVAAPPATEGAILILVTGSNAEQG
jgi:threonine dehydratase